MSSDLEHPSRTISGPRSWDRGQRIQRAPEVYKARPIGFDVLLGKTFFFLIVTGGMRPMPR
jgi:hypothetical protein